uniref:Uncharacterized protein n=1 Tax=Oryza punctata TaxID=4537 RepID=A0A0E0KX73_ORYPU
MQSRSRFRGRDPPPSSGGRYRRRSPSPRRHHRGRDPPPPSHPQRRTPDRPRRQEEDRLPLPPHVHVPPDLLLAAADRRSRADVLLEAGRLAAHYLVAQGVIPEHRLRAREDPKHNRPDTLAAASNHDDDPRWRRNGNKGDDDRLSRRSGWDRRSNSFDSRRKYNDAGADRGGRRSHDYDDQRRPTMSRSYSQNDRRVSSDSRLDRRRRSRSRSRSRSRTRTRSYNYGSSRRESDWRAGGGDLDHTKVPEPGIVRDGDADDVPRDLKAPPRSVVVLETKESASQAAANEDTAEAESEIIEVDQAQDIYGDEDEDGDNAVAGFNDANVGDINVTQHKLSNSNEDDVHPSESDEESVHRQSQFSDAEEGMEAPISPRDACLVEPVAEEVRDEMEAPQSEVQTDNADLSKDEQDLPAWYGIFDLNVVESQENCEMVEISNGSPLDNVHDSVPDLVGQMSQGANCVTSGTQVQDEHAVDNHQLEDEQVPLNQSIGTNDFNNEQGLGNQTGDEHGQDNHQLEDDEIHINHVMDVHNLDNSLMNSEEMLLKRCADEHTDHGHQMETEEMLLNQGQSTSVQVLENYNMNGEQVQLNHEADEHSGDDHPIKNEQMLLNHVMGVHALDNYDLNSEQMLLNNGAGKQAADSAQLQEDQMLLDQAADGQTTLHDHSIGQMIPLINLEDDYEEQSDTIEFLESKSDTLCKLTENVLPEHIYSQGQQTSSIPDHPQTNVPATAASSVTLNHGNRWTGRGATVAQRKRTVKLCVTVQLIRQRWLAARNLATVTGFRAADLTREMELLIATASKFRLHTMRSSGCLNNSKTSGPMPVALRIEKVERLIRQINWTDRRAGMPLYILTYVGASAHSFLPSLT